MPETELAPRRRRRKLLLKAAKDGNHTLLRNLCRIFGIYDKEASWTTEETAVIEAVDGYYLAYDPNDSESFDMCSAGEPSFQTLSGVQSALDSAIIAWE